MTANVRPYEVIAGVCDIYVAPDGTAFPDVDAAVGTAWRPLGQTDGGVKVQHAQTIVKHRTDQTTAPVKVTRTEEDLEINFSLVAVTPENYATVLNKLSEANSLDGGTAGNDKVVKLYRGGFGVETFELLVRGAHLSPEGDFNLQYEVPSVYQGAAPEVDFTKEAKALLACNMVAVAANAFDLDADDEDIFGVLRVGAS
jgi:hypothetical protein